MNTHVLDINTDLDIDHLDPLSPVESELWTLDADLMTLSWADMVVRAISRIINYFLFPSPFAARAAANNNDLESSPHGIYTIFTTARPLANNDLATTPLPFRRSKQPANISTFSTRNEFSAHQAQLRSTRRRNFPPAPIHVPRAKEGARVVRGGVIIVPSPYPSSLPSSDCFVVESDPSPSVYSSVTLSPLAECTSKDDGRKKKFILEPLTSPSPFFLPSPAWRSDMIGIPRESDDRQHGSLVGPTSSPGVCPSPVFLSSPAREI